MEAAGEHIHSEVRESERAASTVTTDAAFALEIIITHLR
jgi:hypothetical protein